MEFKFEHKQPDYVGKLLIASPQMLDPGFQKTVVLIFGISPDGCTLGVVLNKLTSLTVEHCWREMMEDPTFMGRGKEYIRIGGPVAGAKTSTFIAIHANKDLADSSVFEGMYVSVSPEKLRDLIDSRQKAAFYVGSSVWEPGQLEYEFSLGTWLNLSIQPNKVARKKFAANFIYETPQPDMWKFALYGYGRRFLRQVCGIKHFPDNANLN